MLWRSEIYQIDSKSYALMGKPASLYFKFIISLSPVWFYNSNFWNIVLGSRGTRSPALNSFCFTNIKVLITKDSVSFLA